MDENLLAYIPMDRRHAMARGRPLPEQATGAALFADISGFTPLTEALVRDLGPQRGAEELTVYLNRVYDALIDELHRWRGSAIAFAGDAVTCWFDDANVGDDGSLDDGARRAVACALAMQQAMRAFSAIQTPFGSTVSLSMKAAVAAGPVRRFLVGDPGIRVIDAIAGDTLVRLAAAEHEAERAEVILAPCAAAALADVIVRGPARTGDDGRVFQVVTGLRQAVAATPWPPVPAQRLDEAEVRTWLLPSVYARLQRGLGEFLAELRPTVALFLRFTGIDYDGDPESGAKLDAYVRWVQSVVDRYQGTLIDLNIGDKGSYIYINFGAPLAHEDNAARAANTALDLQRMPAHLGTMQPVQIGLSQGRMRAGAYGGRAHRTYGVLGDEVNMAARLMMATRPGQILASQALQHQAEDGFAWTALRPIRVKGKRDPVEIFELVGTSRRQAVHLPQTGNLAPMVGRQAELATFRARLAQARQARGQVVGIVGGPGIGKSRFVAETIHMANADGFAAYGGECAAYGLNTSYLVWQPIWRELFGLNQDWEEAEQARVLEERVAAVDPALSGRVPLLGAVLGLTLPDNELTRAFDPKLRKASLESLLADCLVALAQKQPLLLVLEECHWLDALSHDLAEVLARVIVDLPVVMVLAYRPLELDRLRADRISTLPYYHEIELQELRPDELIELARGQFGQVFDGQVPDDLPASLLDQIVGQAEGNPFYLEELINFIRYRGIDPRDEAALKQLHLPASLQSLVLSRMDQLTESQKTTLKVASVIGRSFRADWLPSIYPDLGDEETVREELVRLTQRGLTAPDPVEPGLTYFFKHVIAHDVIYESLLFMLRADLHEQIAAFIERTYADRLGQFLDLLAHHYDHSDNVDKQREYLRKAGGAAQQAYSNDAAIDYYRRVLPLLAPEEQVEISLKLGEVEQLVGHWDEAKALFAQALSLAQSVQNQTIQPWCKLASGDLRRLQGAYAEAAAWFEAARDEFARLDIQDGVAQALHVSGTLAAQQGDYGAALQRYRESMEIRRRLDDQDGLARLLNNMAIIALYQHDLTSARTLHEESLAIRRRLGDRATVANSLNNLANVLLAEARTAEAHIAEVRLAEAQALLEEAVVLQRETGDRWGLANALNNMGNAARSQGDYGRAQSLYAESMAITRGLGDQWALAYLLEDMGCVAALRGDPARGFMLVGAAQSLRAAIGAPLPPADQEQLELLLAPARAALGSPAATEAQEQGARLSLDQAIDLALR